MLLDQVSCLLLEQKRSNEHQREAVMPAPRAALREPTNSCKVTDKTFDEH